MRDGDDEQLVRFYDVHEAVRERPQDFRSHAVLQDGSNLGILLDVPGGRFDVVEKAIAEAGNFAVVVRDSFSELGVGPSWNRDFIDRVARPAWQIPLPTGST